MRLPTIPVRRLLRDYAIALAFWLPASLLVSWQMYILERRFVPLSYHDILLVYAARYLSVALLTPLANSVLLILVPSPICPLVGLSTIASRGARKP